MEEKLYTIGQKILIGHTPENEARRIVLDVRKHAELWPDAEVQLWVSRRGDAAPYIAQTAYADGEIIWAVTDYDTAMPGCGEAWAAFFGRGDSKLLALAGPSVVTVLPGPHGFATGTPPETTPPWAVQVIEAAREIGEGGGVTPEQIEAAVSDYLAKNPVSGLPEGGVFKDALMINHNGEPEWRHAYWMQMWEEWDGFGVRVESGKSLLDTMKTLNLGLYSVYVKRGMPDNPPGAVETDSSLRGIIGVTTAKGDACYGWVLLWDQDANCYMRYVRSGVASEWKQLNVPIDSTLSVSGAAADAKAVGEALAAGGSGSAGIYVGPEKPDNPNIQVWIDDDGEADPTTGSAYTSPVLIADETIETEDGAAITAYVREFDTKYRRIFVTMYLSDTVGGAKYVNIWNENVEPVKGANAAKSICYVSGSHKLVAFDVETTGTFLDGKVGTGASADNGCTTAYMLVDKFTRNDHINAVYAMPYITGFSVCFSIPSGTQVVVYGWPYDGDGGDDA